MLTPEEAHARAEKELAPEYKDMHGTFYVRPIEYEDDDDYAIIAGAREWLVDQNFEYAIIDDSFHFMSRETGELRPASAMDEEDSEKLEAMREIARG